MPIRKVSKREIIQSALRVFNQQGYHKTSMSDLGGSCGLLKGSIYHYFSSKEQLMHEVLSSGQAYKSLGLIPLLYNEEVPPKQRLERFFQSIEDEELLERGGCLLGNMGLELSNVSEELRTDIKEFFVEWTNAIMFVYKSRYPEERAKQLAEQALQELEGAIMISRVYQNTAFIRDAKKRITSRI